MEDDDFLFMDFPPPRTTTSSSSSLLKRRPSIQPTAAPLLRKTLVRTTPVNNTRIELCSECEFSIVDGECACPKPAAAVGVPSRKSCSSCQTALTSSSSLTCAECKSKRRSHKRKPEEEENDDELSRLPTKKKKKGKEMKKIHRFVPGDSNQVPWSLKYAPDSIEELKLTLDGKKLDQIASFLSEAVSGTTGRRLLIVHGPTGSGKSTAVKVISKELGFRVRDWEEESSSTLQWGQMQDGSFEHHEHRLPYVRQTENFARFLSDCCYPSLSLVSKTDASLSSKANGGTVVLIESLPRGASSLKRDDFSEAHRILNNCVVRLSQNPSLRTCIVYILTVDGNAGASPAQMSEACGDINVNEAVDVAFHSVPEGRMLKTLQSVAKRENLDLETLGLNKSQTGKGGSFEGDVRNALNNLQFLSISPSQGRRPKSRSSSSSSAQKEPIKRDTAFELCHAVGKLLRGRKADGIPFRPEDVARQCSLDPHALAAFLFENFYKFASAANCDLRAYSDVANALVDADCLLGTKWNEMERSGGEDDVDASDGLAESILSRSASCWQQYGTLSGRMISVTKPQQFAVQRGAADAAKRVEEYLRTRGDCSSAGRFVYETMAFSTKITTSHDSLLPTRPLRQTVPITADFPTCGPGHYYRKRLDEDEVSGFDASLLFEENVEEY